MLDLVAKEITIVTMENEHNVDCFYNYEENEISLHYHQDNTYCYYKYIEEKE